MTLRCTLIGIIVFISSSCSPEEPLITSYQGNWRLLVSGPSGLYTIAMPEGTIQQPVWQSAEPELFPVRRIVEFRNELYLLRATNEIVVLDRSTLAVIDTIQLGSNGYAEDIAFANATTAYVSLPQLGAVGVVDLTVNQLVFTIDVGGETAGIAAVGNQICVVLPLRQEAKIIDSRTNTVQATISLPTESPTMVQGDGASGVFCIVALGGGKLAGSSAPLTTPTLTSVDIASRSILSTIPLTSRESEGPQQLPTGFAVNSSGFCYTAVQNGLLQAATRNPRRAAAIQFDGFTGCWYDASRAFILCTRESGTVVEVYDEFAENMKHTVNIPDSANCLVGLAP